MPKRSPEGPQPWSAHVRATAVLALPLVGTQLAQMTMGVTDTLMLGWLGAAELAGRPARHPGDLSRPTSSASASRRRRCRSPPPPRAPATWRACAASCAWASGCSRSTAPWCMLPLWHAERILLALGQNPEIAGLAGDYVGIAMWSMLPALMVTGFRAFLTVVGHAYVLLAVIATGAIVNGVLNYLLIFGHGGFPALGVAGSALGDLDRQPGHGARCSSPTPWAPGRSRATSFSPASGGRTGQAFAEILRLGWPIGATIIAEVGLFVTAVADDGLDRHRAAGGARHRAAARLGRLHDSARHRQRRRPCASAWRSAAGRAPTSAAPR